MSKITVMIVDDEKFVIDDLISMFNWEANDFEIVATAVNGKQALAKFNEFTPQIVITDIKMPFMDGIELVKNIRSLNVQTKFLLLTAYSDFEYAKQAIQLGITDYILKGELNEQTIEERLLSVREKVATECKTSFFLSQKVILDLFSSSSDETLGKFTSDPSVMKLLSANFYYLIIEEDLPIPISGVSLDENIKRYEYDIIGCCISFDSEYFNVVSAGSIQKNRILLLIQAKSNYLQQINEYVLSQEAEGLKKKLEDRFQSSFSIYYIHDKLNLLEMKKIYTKFQRRLYAKYLLGNGKVLDFLNSNLDLVESGLLVDEEILESFIENLDSRAALEYIEKIYSCIIDSNMDYEVLLSVSQFIYSILKKRMLSLPGIASKPDLKSNTNKKDWLNAYSIKNWMKDKFNQLINEKRKVLENQYSNTIIKTMEFIYKNYSNKKLIINQIADHLLLSATHLSVLFKKETNMTINEYITDIRIKKAKELLDDGSLKVYEVASLVGYGSSQYFSQIFFNMTGLNPNDYRKRITK